MCCNDGACSLTVIANSLRHYKPSDLSHLFLVQQGDERGVDQLPQSSGRSQHQQRDQVKLHFTTALRFVS